MTYKNTRKTSDRKLKSYQLSSLNQNDFLDLAAQVFFTKNPFNHLFDELLDSPIYDIQQALLTQDSQTWMCLNTKAKAERICEILPQMPKTWNKASLTNFINSVLKLYKSYQITPIGVNTNVLSHLVDVFKDKTTPSQGIKDLLQTLINGDKQSRIVATRIAGMLDRDSGITILKYLIDDPSFDVQLTVARAASKIGGQEGIEIINSLAKGQRSARMAAAYGAGFLERGQGHRILRTFLNDHSHIKMAAAYGAGIMGGQNGYRITKSLFDEEIYDQYDHKTKWSSDKQTINEAAAAMYGMGMVGLNTKDTQERVRRSVFAKVRRINWPVRVAATYAAGGMNIQYPLKSILGRENFNNRLKDDAIKATRLMGPNGQPLLDYARSIGVLKPKRKTSQEPVLFPL